MSNDAWADLSRAIEMLSWHKTDIISPFHCEHDQLSVMSDATAYAPEELAELEELGFDVDEDGGFYSFRYGSA